MKQQSIEHSRTPDHCEVSGERPKKRSSRLRQEDPFNQKVTTGYCDLTGSGSNEAIELNDWINSTIQGYSFTLNGSSRYGLNVHSMASSALCKCTTGISMVSIAISIGSGTILHQLPMPGIPGNHDHRRIGNKPSVQQASSRHWYPLATGTRNLNRYC